MKKNLIIGLMWLLTSLSWAIDSYDFATEADRKRFQDFTKTMRCPKCQNQNLSDSNSPIAADLRQVLYDMIVQKKSDKEVVDFMVNRYGDFVLYEPKVERNTWLLWFSPLVFLVLGVFIITRLAKKPTNKVEPSRVDQAQALSTEERARLDQLLKESDDS